MAYDRLQKLGEERFRKILNNLMTGESAMGTARMIQQEWHEFQDVAEKTLTQQLNRLRKDAAEGMFGKHVAAKVKEAAGTGQAPQIEALATVTTSALDRMEELAGWHRERVMNFKKKEESMPIPVGSMLAQTNQVFSEYRETLNNIQKMRFDMGLDKFAGPVQTARGASVSVTHPDGTVVQAQVVEAMQMAEEILNSRGVPRVIDVPKS